MKTASPAPVGLRDPLVRAGLVLGMGFAGLADGIILHQILGWHHLVCVTWDCQVETVTQLERANTQDGYFHLALGLVVLVGTTLLFRAARTSTLHGRGRVLLGAILSGGGLFNLGEGLINHHLLGIHHVLPGSSQQLAWDLLYLGNGMLFAGLGAWLLRRSGP
jgi:uncharacterized membrane protein